MSWLVVDVTDVSTLDYTLFGCAGADTEVTSADAVDSASDTCADAFDPLVVPSGEVSTSTVGSTSGSADSLLVPSSVGSTLVRFVSVRVPVCMSLPVSSNELSFRDYCCSHTFIHSGCVLVVLAA
jgi:hypothetical protein